MGPRLGRMYAGCGLSSNNGTAQVKQLGRLEIAFLIDVGGIFLIQQWLFVVAAAIPNDALIATNILGRFCPGFLHS